MDDETASDQLSVSVDGADVLLQMPGSAARRLPPDMADQLAQRLLDAADEARGGPASRGSKPPFPPSDLVSPHGAG
jgi:hypothetical protein